MVYPNEIILKEFCSQQHISLKKILNYNQQKQTYVILANENDDNSLIVMKIFLPNATMETKHAFENELKFYQKNTGNFFMNLKLDGDNFFAIDYFDGISLPQYIKANFFIEKNFDLSLFLSKINQLFDSFFFMQNEPVKITNSEKQIIFEKFYDRIGNLISSGPKGTKKNNFESFILRQCFKISLPTLRKKLKKTSDEFTNKEMMIQSKYGHNDFHCNNILISKNYQVKLIDFEHVSSPGIWLSDILYFTATLVALFSDDVHAVKMIKNNSIRYMLTREPKLQNKSESLLNLFCLAAEANSRFRFQSGINLKKILKFFFCVWRIRD